MTDLDDFTKRIKDLQGWGAKEGEILYPRLMFNELYADTQKILTRDEQRKLETFIRNQYGTYSILEAYKIPDRDDPFSQWDLANKIGQFQEDVNILLGNVPVLSKPIVFENVFSIPEQPTIDELNKIRDYYAALDGGLAKHDIAVDPETFNAVETKIIQDPVSNVEDVINKIGDTFIPLEDVGTELVRTERNLIELHTQKQVLTPDVIIEDQQPITELDTLKISENLTVKRIGDVSDITNYAQESAFIHHKDTVFTPDISQRVLPTEGNPMENFPTTMIPKPNLFIEKKVDIIGEGKPSLSPLILIAIASIFLLGFKI